MDLFKIIKIFFTVWFIIFGIIYLTRCKRSNSPNIDIAIEKPISIPSTSAVETTNNIVTKSQSVSPATLSVVPRAKKPVKLIYLK
jgi:hypothetical protein